MRASILAAWFGLMLCGGLHAAVEKSGQEGRFTDRWIIHLVDQPTLEFAGSHAAPASLGPAALPMLEATAPSVTGRAFDPQAPEVRAYASHLEQRQADVLADAAVLLGRKIAGAGRALHTANVLVLDISPEEATRIADLPGVDRVERERLYRLELAAGPRQIGAPPVWRGDGDLPALKGEGVLVGVVDSGINWDHRAFSDDPADTAGYVFTNPLGRQLGLCSRADIPCNDKLIGVYDFTSESTDGLDTDGHGTHVAAIAVANEWSDGQSGVAPRASLVSYRVCRDQDPEDEDAGTCEGGAIIDALEQAVIDGVDVVNFSIGSEDSLNPWTSATARQVLNLHDAGITFVTSGGNSGPDPATVGWPAEAPWVVAVGSSSTSACAAGSIDIEGLGTRAVTYGSGPNDSGPEIDRVVVRRGGAFDNNALGCSAFPAGAFDNAIALLERGDCTFEEKVGNAERAGAVAVLMFNNESDGRICMAGLENTGVPSAMLSRQHGLELNGLISSGDTQRVSFNREGLADQVSGFSSRGPSRAVPGVMKPNLLAPGQGIQAAYVPGREDTAGLVGTSMASPHVAGSVALLRQLFPDLTPAQASSMLETTAEADPVTVAGAAVTIFDRGAGRARIDLATRAGLYLPVTRQQFLSASPALGGDPGALNLAGLVDENCGRECTFTRTVRALRPGAWTVDSQGEPGLSVQPETFALQAGESQVLSITVRPQQTGASDLQHGEIALVPSSSDPSPGLPALTTQKLQVGVRSDTGEVNLPEFVPIEADAQQGYLDLDLGFVGTLPEAVFPTTSLVRPVVERFSLPEDGDRDDPYDDDAGTRTFLVDVPEGTLALWTETTASSAPDIDLFVGRDANRDGAAQPGEERCRSITPDELERCVIQNPTPGTWWVLVQNWQGSAADEDSVELELAVLKEAPDTSLTAFGPGRHEAGVLNLDVYWDRPDLKQGERVLGAVGIGSRPDRGADIGAVPVAVRLDRRAEPQTTVVFPGESVPVSVPAGGRHDRLVFDLPPTATSVRVEVQGESGVSATLRRVPFSDLADVAPSSPAPAGPVLASGSNSAAGFTLIQASGVEAGRYFVELDNAADEDRTVTVRVDVEQSAGVVPRFGMWSPVGTPENPREESNQGIEWQQDGAGFVLWYSYDPAGLPVFYLGTGELDPDSSVWVARVDRYTIGDGPQMPDPAGTVGVTAISEEEMVFSWRLGGGHGSDLKTNFNAATCPEIDGEPVSYTGTWFTPGQDQGGSSVVVTHNAQGHIRYYYDRIGVGRWVLATDGGGAPLSEELELFEFRGFCPNCEPTEVSSEVVGVFSRVYEDEDSGVEAMEFISRPPLDEQVSTEVPIVKLSAPVECP